MDDLLAGDFYGFQGLLTEREDAAVRALRDYLEAEVRPLADDFWARAEFPVQVARPLGGLGVLGTLWEETRAFPGSAVYRGWLMLELSRVDAGVGAFVGISSGLVMGALGVGGSAEQRAEWLPRLATGELVGAFGLTEPLSGSDSARGLRTTAERTADGWVLNGAKRWIGNATFADVTVIWAKDVADGQVKGFLVEKGTPGFAATRIENKVSLRSVQNADITLNDVVIPEARRLQRIDSFRDVATILRLTRADVAWQAIGVAIGAYEAAVRYAGSGSSSGSRSGRTSSCRTSSSGAWATSPRASPCACACRSCTTRAPSATSTRRSRRPTRRRACARRSAGLARCSAATASCSSTASRGSSPTPRPSTPTRAPGR
ncbi:hypothetical protein GCM10025866_34140 [Naasia aerilata]|uniref:Acyl-CoA dehydrogenase n=1 Tax=Naasia aerilata TaxID=1162966 RepID=A0ABN6XV23_9MICO|nr:hypothetical protein GCM10025866_34140 [Naasia aerilata]